MPPSFAVYLEILGASTFWRPKGLSRPAKGQLNFTMQVFCYLELFSYNMHVLVGALFIYRSLPDCTFMLWPFKVTIMFIWRLINIKVLLPLILKVNRRTLKT
jgi:hypothetical protein